MSWEAGSEETFLCRSLGSVQEVKTGTTQDRVLEEDEGTRQDHISQS